MKTEATPLRRTEALHDGAEALDALAPDAALAVLVEGQIAAAQAVRNALPALARAAQAVAATLAGGGRLIYAGAGSSGLMALADALELPGTFGIAAERVSVLLAGGIAALSDLAGGPEDDAAQGATDLADLNPRGGDCLVAVSASGATPYAMGALDAANVRGVTTVAIANNAGAPMLLQAAIPVLLPTPPEVLAGSTRMGAGTAQKIALNMLSTLAASHLGHVHGPFMVNLRADNAKLKARAARMVAAIAGVASVDAESLLERSGGTVKEAVLLGCGADDLQAAQALLDKAGGRLRPAIEKLQHREPRGVVRARA